MPDRPTPGQRPSGHSPSTEAEFTERHTVPWWWWPLGIGVAALLAAEVHMGYPGIRAWLPYLLTVPLAGAVLLRMGSRQIRLSGGELQVGPARVPLHQLGRVQVIRVADKQRALGPDLDPAAFVLHSPWIGPLIRVELIDPQDPTPYWIFSVRRAEDLAALLRADPGEAAQPGSGGPSPA